MDTKTLETNLAVVRRLCEQWPWLTREAFHELLAADCDYRNVPVEGDKHIGPDDAHDMLSRTRRRWEVTLELTHIVGDGAIVLTERLERFKHLKGERDDCALPVMGAFELRDGKIVAWRDYFDLAQAKPLMS